MLMLPLTIAMISAVAQPPAPAAGSLVAAEYAFADQSEKDGTRAAYLGALHPDGMVFIPRPVNGIAYYKTHLEFGAALQWFPTRIEASAAGDLGYSTGPFTFRTAKDAPVSVFGWFVSIWERDGAAPWKVRLDIGITTPDPSDLPAPAPLPRSTASLTATAAGKVGTSPELLALDRTFSDDATKNIGTAYKARVDAGVRLYRKGRFPLEGAAALDRYLDQYPVNFQPETSLVSGSGDLGMTRGLMNRLDPAGKQTSYYVHIWKKAAGAWKLAVEVELPTK